MNTQEQDILNKNDNSTCAETAPDAPAQTQESSTAQAPAADAVNDGGKRKKEKKDKSKRNKRKRRFGDRKEGRRLRSLDGLHVAMPFIMKDRSDACNTFADEIEISEADLFVREQIMSGKENFSMLHVILAAYVRTVSQYPYLNRFISGQRIFARHKIEINMTVKKEMNIHSPETCIKVIFEPKDTIYDVYDKFNAEIAKIQNDTGTDNVAAFFKKFPRIPFRWAVKVIGWLDYWGMLPQSLMNSLPFWGSMIITSMGSLGIKPIYHHLYNFGNLPIFVSYGTKRKVISTDKKGNITSRKVIDLKVVTDERTCDGFQYATAFKMWKKLIENPESLKTPPAQVFEDVD
ncbi:MAG: 2-oxo acid dehydrogenase subunit E2 [Ruminococcaceae bacterium]|nr:2-oxo acid dehydrogenase subunit E2 [Oscillospiraceae bacterium]